MMLSMRTTIRLDDDLLRALKAHAARTGRSMTALIEDAVRESLSRTSSEQPNLESLPVYGGSGTMPGVDLTDAGALLEVMEEGEPLDALR
jgi:plasmid stability protein